MNITSRVLIAVLVLSTTQQATADPPSFMGLGHFVDAGHDISGATGISGDGSTVVGQALAPALYGVFQWTEEGGLTDLGIPTQEPHNLTELILDGPTPDISFDGSTIVGVNYFSEEAFRWTESGGEEPLGFLAGGNESRATGVSGDGSIVVGFAENDSNDREAFRWTESSGMVGLGFLPGGSDDSQANEISADGSTIVGSGGSSSPIDQQAFRWTEAEGMVELADNTGTIEDSAAFDVSQDGSVIVGYAEIIPPGGLFATRVEPFRWTEEEGMVPLGLPDETYDVGIGYGVSGDGSVVVGMSIQHGDLSAILWDAEHGTRILQDVLTNDYGLDLTGWELYAAFDVSADGRTIVGYGENPDGDTEAFIAVVPEPSTFMLAGSGLFALAVCIWRKRRGF